MSAYSIVNLKKEVEDSMGERAPGIEGRFARKHLDSKHLGISYLRYSPGVRSPSAHSHREQEEAYIVISGSGQVRLDDEIRELRRWDVVRVNPATVRAFEAGDDSHEHEDEFFLVLEGRLELEVEGREPFVLGVHQGVTIRVASFTIRARTDARSC